MRIVHCEHPKYILSPYTGEMVLARCGYCATCANSRAKKWIQRLDSESAHHKYTYMVTLTYSDENLPCMFFDDEMEYLVCNHDSTLRVPLLELIELCKDEYGEYLEYELKYLRDRLIHPLGLPCICTKDFQNFFKRFNKYCFKHVTQKYENFRYFLAHEYGPTTYRNHVHLLMWFDDDRICKRFEEILSASWSFGNTDASMVYSSGGRSYAAQYLDRPTHLPSFYLHPCLRQRCQFSKSPSIGSLQILDKDVRHYVDRKPLYRVVWDERSAAYSSLPIMRLVTDRLFPKCPEYSKRSHFDRTCLYRACEVLPSTDFEEFRKSIEDLQWLTYRQIANKSEYSIGRYIENLKLDIKDSSSFDNSLRRLYRMSKLVIWNSRLCGFSVDYYVKQIEDYHLKVDYENLKEMYSFQEEYCKKGNKASDLINMYPEFSQMVFCLSDSDFGLNSFYRSAIATFGVDYPTRLEDTADFKSMMFLHNRIFQDSHKRKKSNAYIDGRLYRHDRKLSKIIKDFQKWHEI